MTFTRKPEDDAYGYNPPSDEYLDIIRRGIKETYPEFSEIEINSYLMKYLK